jgi:beta-lactamase regulating signal transducer with metallopeptidase domain
MNISGHVLLWCPVQVTVLAIAALGIDAVIGRRRPAARALVAASALIAVVGLTATAMCPWPAWAIAWDGLPWRHMTESSQTIADRQEPDIATGVSTSRFGDDRGSDGSFSKRSTSADEKADSVLGRFWATVASNWAMLVAILYVVGVGGMAVRFGLGLAAVRSYRRDSRPVADRRLRDLVNVVRVELGYRKDVQLRETARLSTPATIGWRRPILLLPSDWPSWTNDECRAVLAHEIEHVRRSDFSSWIVAQIGVALHFYHPLVHSLANRLRLQQELAADAAAARLVGGQRKYVTMLAAMALRQSDSLVAWPAQAFLTGPKTFLRRIEMLHRSKSLQSGVSRPLCVFTVAAVALAAAFAAGVRGSSAADEGEKASQTQKNLKALGIAMHNYHDIHRRFPPASVVGPDGKTVHSWRVELLTCLPFSDEKIGKALYDQYRMNEPWDSPANQKVLARMPDVFRSPYDDPRSPNSGYYALVGTGTVFEGTKVVRTRDITDGLSYTLMIVEAKRNIPWTKPEDIPFDADKPLPKLGGFVEGKFAAMMSDGAVRLFDTERVKDQLKWLILRNDGHIIERP